MESTNETDPVERLPISALVTSYNASSHIRECLQTLAWCDEILVVDSFSEDDTVQIAESFEKVRVLQRKYYGAASQKNWAIEKVKHDWILILDVDERVTPALRGEIEKLLSGSPAQDAYTIARRVYFLGKPIRFSGWQNDSVTRLFRKGCGYYENRRVHARLVTTGPAPLLRNPMDHYMVDTLEEYVQRLTRYGYWGAAQCWIDGRRSSWAQIFVRTVYRFIRTYGLQLGFLDGTPGLAFCLLQAYATYVKWALLWSWQVNTERGRKPELPEFDPADKVWSGLQKIRARPQTSGR